MVEHNRPTFGGAVESASVTIRQRDGNTYRAFLIPGGLLVTAAGCTSILDWIAPDPPDPEELYQTVVTTDGSELLVQALCVDPINDVAFFGRVEETDRPLDQRAFDAFARNTEPLPIARGFGDDGQVDAPQSVFVLTHNGHWVFGIGQTHKLPGELVRKVHLEMDYPVESASLGSAVLNSAGEVIGVVSGANGMGTQVQCPFLFGCMPLFLMQQSIGGLPDRTPSKWDDTDGPNLQQRQFGF